MMMGGGGPMEVVVTPPQAFGSGSGTIQSNTVTASVPGFPECTFVWSYYGGDPTVNSILPLTSASQRWSSPVAPGADKSAEWLVTALLHGNPVGSNVVTIFLQAL